ncbi:hypothetical protein BVH03_24925 [Pseudomonas sp. PA15(2017)]|uniref:hypothetical protein n=1 Tax=Pseudomonas sp. PA15(2017) TaxID=1932111 RepID=UPI0009675A7F|nr:hypothetical protein [Pseudomonas sp. PA15(2017)]OLU22472.1 hypothetical protein BVH03_24925 [Pseudomonas sp. PA15(2017)]
MRGVGLLQVGAGVLQLLLGLALGGDVGAHGDDLQGLASVALLERGDSLGGQGLLGLGGLALLVAAPDEQGDGGEQGEAIGGLAQGRHAATCWPQPQPAWRS